MATMNLVALEVLSLKEAVDGKRQYKRDVVAKDIELNECNVKIEVLEKDMLDLGKKMVEAQQLTKALEEGHKDNVEAISTIDFRIVMAINEAKVSRVEAFTNCQGKCKKVALQANQQLDEFGDFIERCERRDGIEDSINKLSSGHFLGATVPVSVKGIVSEPVDERTPIKDIPKKPFDNPLYN
ncbi:hypothetical protein V6N13_048967 [Hibiscus sabdariffa]